MPTLHLTPGQARALLEHSTRTPPQTLDGRAQRALARAAVKLRNAVEDIEYNEFKADLRQLTEVLLDADKRPLVDAVHRRLRDIRVLVLLWTAAERLPPEHHAVLDIERLDDPSWPAEVLDLLDRSGIEIELPGDDLGDGEDEP